MKRILLGGSPCTFWSIAQKNNRETEASGIGWELFKNYLIAKEKFKPDYFLYENNVSAAQPIKNEIKRQLGVWGGTFLTPYSDVRYVEINSALVSAQNRERFYVHNCGEVGQPKDRGILLKDILESGCDLTGNEKSYALTTRCNGAIPEDTLTKHRHNMVAEPCIFQNPHGYNDGGMKYCKTPTLTANGCWQENNKVVEPIRIEENKTVQNALQKLVDKYGYIPEMYNPYNASEITDKSPTLSTGSMVTSSCATIIHEPIRVCSLTKSQGNRIYDINAKSCAVTAQGGGLGGHTGGLYAIPCDKVYAVAVELDDNGRPTKAISYADGKLHTVYEVKDGKITIKGKEYPIKLTDGYYIIRKLTVNECRRLQTIPDWYKMPCSDTQNYKLLGNGWTIEVIKHILSHIPEIAKGEPIEVLSMYDGMSCGRIALKELGANVVKYYATEIDKYAIQTTQANFPDTIQLGDAFQVRDKEWKL